MKTKANAISSGIERLEQEVAAAPDDGSARFRVAVLLLEQFHRTGHTSLLTRAREHLAHAIALQPAHARLHATQGYAHDLGENGAEPALACFAEAHRLGPAEALNEVYLMTLLAETGREAEALQQIEAAASRLHVDLHSLRQALAAAEFPQNAKTLIQNGFVHARNHFRSSLADEAESILDALDPGRAGRLAEAEQKRCAACQQHLARTFDASRVPEPLRALSTWATGYGIGDDVCRAFLLSRLSLKQKMALIAEVDQNAAAIHAWLDSFGNTSMPPEAAAFLFLAQGVEEIRDLPTQTGALAQ